MLLFEFNVITTIIIIIIITIMIITIITIIIITMIIITMIGVIIIYKDHDCHIPHISPHLKSYSFRHFADLENGPRCQTQADHRQEQERNNNQTAGHRLKVGLTGEHEP